MNITESELLQICLTKILFPELVIPEELQTRLREDFEKITSPKVDKGYPFLEGVISS